MNSPVEYVRDFLQSQNNYFAVIEEAAEELCKKLGSHFRAIPVKKLQMENPLASIANHIGNTAGLAGAGIASKGDAKPIEAL